MGDMMLPRVSIVTISFNQAEFLERAICSVIDQDYPDVEYIVVDAGSTDGSREIIEKHRSRISKVILEPDSGPANGLNKGFAAATGEIYGYINADDAFLPGTISKAVGALRKRPRADVVYGHCYIVDRDGRIVRRSRSNSFNLRLYAYGAAIIMQQSSFYRREAFERVGGFNESNRTCWDAELLMMMGLNGSRLEMVNDFWSLYAIYSGSITATLKHNQLYKADRARMFRAMVGRDFQPIDKIWSAIARIEKWIRNPLMVVHRFVDKTPMRAKLPPMVARTLS